MSKISRLGALMMNEVKVEKICKDAVDLLISVKLGKITKKVTLEEVISKIGKKINYDKDTTRLIREMRKKI